MGMSVHNMFLCPSRRISFSFPETLRYITFAWNLCAVVHTRSTHAVKRVQDLPDGWRAQQVYLARDKARGDFLVSGFNSIALSSFASFQRTFYLVCARVRVSLPGPVVADEKGSDRGSARLG